MRSSIVLTSALALGATASPLRMLKRYFVTEVDLEIKTITVFVTPGQAIPTAGQEYGHSHGHGHSHSIPKPSATPSYLTSAPSSTPVYTPQPAPETSQAYTPPPPSSTPTPTPTPQPSSAPAYTPEPEPSSVVSSQAPAPSSPSGEHKSGEIQATFSSGADYQAAILYHHNAARANHGADPLTWDDSCAKNAEITARTCKFEHYVPSGAGQGQNLFTVSGDDFNVTAGITESWYKGEFQAMTPYWGAKDIPDSVFENVGHLTQMLWKGTSKVGCFSFDCGNSMTVGSDTQSSLNKYTVCNYAAQGNIVGEYGDNVAKPISTTNLGSWLD